MDCNDWISLETNVQIRWSSFSGWLLAEGKRFFHLSVILLDFLGTEFESCHPVTPPHVSANGSSWAWRAVQGKGLRSFERKLVPNCGTHQVDFSSLSWVKETFSHTIIRLMRWGTFLLWLLWDVDGSCPGWSLTVYWYMYWLAAYNNRKAQCKTIRTLRH